MEKLSTEKIKTALALVPDWKRKGLTIVRTYQFKGFPAAIKFVKPSPNSPRRRGIIRILTFVGTG